MDKVGLLVIEITVAVMVTLATLGIYLGRRNDKTRKAMEEDANKYGYSLYGCKYQSVRLEDTIECKCNKDGFLHIKRIANWFANIDSYYHYHIDGLGYTFYNLLQGNDDPSKSTPEYELWGFKDFYNELHLAMEYYFRSYGENHETRPVCIENAGNLHGFTVWIDEEL